MISIFKSFASNDLILIQNQLFGDFPPNTDTYVYVCMNECMYLYIYVYTRVYVYPYSYTHAYAYTLTYINKTKKDSYSKLMT